MRKIFEWVGGFALIVFSFYFTDKVSLMVAARSELMQEIKAVSSTYELEPEDAVINIKDNSIIPGRFGRVVNSQESYLSMHDFGSFNENFLIFDYIKPKNSLEDNKDKFITSGNPKNRQVSFIVEDNAEIEELFDVERIDYDKVVTKFADYNSNVELINGANKKDEFNELNTKLKNNPRICLKNTSNIELCEKNSYYLVNPLLILNNSNLIEVKSSVNPGSIILIASGLTKENLKIVLNEIKYKDLDIVHISKLINEKGNR